jgi:hypothetical protein
MTPDAERGKEVGGEKIRNWLKERNKILGICNLCRLSTVFGGEPKKKDIPCGLYETLYSY